jgi:hypothetical protein
MEANMFKMTHDLETGEFTREDFTQEEIDVFLTNRAEQEKINAELETKVKTFNEAKAALLTKLGITEDEARLLLS